MKLKTHQSTAKKIKITGSKKNKKIMTKHAGQNHFNARETGNQTRHKRKNVTVAKMDAKNIKFLLPYS